MDEAGPTGRFPDGRLNAEDEGELVIRLSVEGRCVRIDFGKPVAWLALDPQTALNLAFALLNHARQIAAHESLPLLDPLTGKPLEGIPL